MSSRRITELEQQMAHLEWKKAQNERAYRQTMEKTRVMHQNDIILKMSVDNNSEKAAWMKSVIRDELSKPLVLSDAEMFALTNRIERDQTMLKKVRYNVDLLTNHSNICCHSNILITEDGESFTFSEEDEERYE
jgi:bifunctional ADP-heptose synthase (sugar kinase/adenylyltransferase)